MQEDSDVAASRAAQIDSDDETRADTANYFSSGRGGVDRRRGVILLQRCCNAKPQRACKAIIPAAVIPKRSFQGCHSPTRQAFLT
jgi:hypothetical protein